MTYTREKSRELRWTFLGRLRERMKGFRQRREKRRSRGTFQSKAVRNDVTWRESGTGSEHRGKRTNEANLGIAVN